MALPSELTIPLPSTTEVLADLLRDHLTDFEESVEESGDGARIPAFVHRELLGITTCGDFSRGFLRLACERCKAPRILPFACHGRLCPRCGARTMSERASFLVDRVLPSAPYRQWVLTFPPELARHLAFDPSLATTVIRLFMRVVLQWYRSNATPANCADALRPHAGGIVWIQRFSDGLGLYFHLHALVMEGVFWERRDSLSVSFAPATPPGDSDVEHLIARLATRIRDLLLRRARRCAAQSDVGEPDPAVGPTAFLLRCAQSVAERVTRSEAAPGSRRAARRARKPLCRRHSDFELHASVDVTADDRGGLERLARYLGRPALASGRLRRLPDGRIECRLRRPRRGGLRALRFHPHALIARLCALIPPPKSHQIRFFGCFSNASSIRRAILPVPPDPKTTGVPTAPPRPARMSWAHLLERVFASDAQLCSCGGRLRLVSVITQPDIVEALAAAIILSDQARGRPPPGHTPAR